MCIPHRPGKTAFLQKILASEAFCMYNIRYERIRCDFLCNFPILFNKGCVIIKKNRAEPGNKKGRHMIIQIIYGSFIGAIIGYIIGELLCRCILKPILDKRFFKDCELQFPNSKNPVRKNNGKH